MPAMRVYYSSYHLWAALRFAREAACREKALEASTPVFDIEQRAYVTSGVVSSAAFLEAAINEVLKDAADAHHSYVGELESDGLRRLKRLWDKTEGPEGRRIPMLKKYQQALVACSRQPFTEGQFPHQDAATLVHLRNHLLHFKPRTATAYDEQALQRHLAGKFRLNSLIPEPCGNPFFPDKCLGAGCAQWAVDSALGLADEFFSRLGVVPNYQRVDFKPAQVRAAESKEE